MVLCRCSKNVANNIHMTGYGAEVFPKTGGFTMNSRQISELPLHLDLKNYLMRCTERHEDGGKQKNRLV